jgi:hypothetical protein
VTKKLLVPATINGETVATQSWVATQIGGGVPAGGTTGQVLAKASDTDYDTEWVTAPTDAVWLGD